MLSGRSRTIQATSGVIGLLASALIMIPGSANAERNVPSGTEGPIEVWGATSELSGAPVRETYTTDGPWSAVTLGSLGDSFAISKTGKLKRLSGTVPELDVPANLAIATVTAVSTYGKKAAAVLADGSVQLWGDSRVLPPQTLTTTTLGSKAVDVAMGGPGMLVILLEDKRVGMLTNFGYEIVELEDGVELQNALQIGVNITQGFARLAGGGIVSWTTSGPITGYPAEVRGDNLADPVADFAVNGLGLVAVTDSGVVYTWESGQDGPMHTVAPLIFPADSVDSKVVDVAASARYFGASTDQNEVSIWGQFDATNVDYPFLTTVPAELDGKQIPRIVGGGHTFAAIATAPLPPLSETAKPKIAGSARVGQTLTGTPATFDGSPESVANRWLANDEAISGATANTFTLTADQLGKNITFESTATRGSDTLVSKSVSAGPVNPPLVASTTVVSAPSKAYGSAGTATVTVSSTGGLPVTGTVTVSGAGATQTKAVVGGKATFSLAKNLAPKAYTVTAKYNGSAQLSASSRAVKYTVAKGKVKAPVYKTTKSPTSKKKGKATVTVTAPSGLAKATGKVTVTLKKGSSKKLIKATLSGGKKSITLPKLKKGTYKVTIFYAGDKNYASAKSKTYTLKIKK